MLPTKFWAEMSWRDFAAADMSKVVAVLPVAAIEQHGPHLPVGVDTFINEGYLATAVPRIPDDMPVLILPIQAVGKSNEHVEYPGTLTFSLETITRAWTEHDGPFNWEGEYFHYRQVNVWPRVWQEPHPPVWSTTGSTTQARVLGERGYVMATLGTGFGTRKLYDAYRKSYLAKHGKAPGPDRFAYLGLVAVANDREEAKKRGELIAGYLRTSPIVYPPFRNPPGYLSVEDNARLLRGETPPRSFTKEGRAIDMRTASVPELIQAGILFCGTPDQVYGQIVEFCEYCGGMGNLLMMGHAGPMSHADTVDNLTLFANEVLPRLAQYKQPATATATAA